MRSDTHLGVPTLSTVLLDICCLVVLSILHIEMTGANQQRLLIARSSSCESALRPEIARGGSANAPVRVEQADQRGNIGATSRWPDARLAGKGNDDIETALVGTVGALHFAAGDVAQSKGLHDRLQKSYRIIRFLIRDDPEGEDSPASVRSHGCGKQTAP
jgi:hypothetical protein